MPQAATPTGNSFAVILPPTRTTAETTTVAGVDLNDFVDDLLVILSYARPNASAGFTFSASFKDSSDNSTFTALAAPTFANVTTATVGSATVCISRRAIKRYLQASFISAGTTGTLDASIVAIGLKKSL